MIVIRAARITDIEAIAAAVRPAQAAELALRGETPTEALQRGLAASVEAWTACDDDHPIAMWGITTPNLLGVEAHPWVITSAGTDHHKVRFWRETKAAIADMLSRYPVLSNEFDALDGEALRILRHLGFVPADASVAAEAGPPNRFQTFERRG